MAKRSIADRESRSALLPAWASSVLLHAALLATFLVIYQPQQRGASPEPLREAGIVLKQTSLEGERFLGEEDVATSESTPTTSVDSRAVPSELPTTDDLPEMLATSESPGSRTEGPGAAGQPGGAPASGGRPGFLGNKARVSIFGVEGEGTRFVYVFDRSVSMEGRPLAAAKRQLLASLDSLESVHQFQIIFFNHQVKAWDLTGGQQRIAFATDRNKRLAENFVRGITATGGTYRRIALASGLALGPDVVFFLSDSDDPMSDTDVAEAIFRANNSGTAINCIEFGLGSKPSGRNFLVRLAEGTGGGYAYVSTADLDSDLYNTQPEKP